MELRDNYESWTREELRAALALSEQKRQEAEEEVTRLHDVVLEANEYAKRLYDNRRQVEEERDALLGQLSVCKEALEYYANHEPHPPNRARRALSSLPAIASKRDAVVEAAIEAEKKHSPDCNCHHGCTCKCRCTVCLAVRALKED
jgi:hypothetical protein